MYAAVAARFAASKSHGPVASPMASHFSRNSANLAVCSGVRESMRCGLVDALGAVGLAVATAIAVDVLRDTGLLFLPSVGGGSG